MQDPSGDGQVVYLFLPLYKVSMPAKTLSQQWLMSDSEGIFKMP